MKVQEKKQLKSRSFTPSLFFKCGTVLLLLLLSALMVACGASATPTANLSGPAPTVTISLNNAKGSPTPTVTPYSCGAWVTNTTPSLFAGTIVVNAKFVQNVNGTPAGVGGAYAQANVAWADGGASPPISTTTTGDGLATFAISLPNRTSLLDKETLVTVTFSKSGVPTCTVDGARAAFFVVIPGTPTVTATATQTSPFPFPTTNPRKH